MNFKSALLAVPALLLVACAAPTGDDASTAQTDSQDLTTTATGVSLDDGDNGKSVIVEEGKKITVQLTFGGFVASPFGKYDVSSTDKTLGAPRVTVKTPHIPDAPTTEKLEWKTAGLASATKHKVTLTAKSLNGGDPKTFSFTVKIVAKKATGAGAGEMCGGIAGLPCDAGLDCVIADDSHPDASGTCRVRTIGGLGDTCGGIAGLGCEEGLACELEGNYPDAAGKCSIVN